MSLCKVKLSEHDVNNQITSLQCSSYVIFIWFYVVARSAVITSWYDNKT